MNPEQDYMKLLDLLARVVEANKGPLTGPDDRFWYAHGLAIKLFLHASSAFYVSRQIRISDFPSARLKFDDPASISVLARAALETFLTFHYVFVQPKTLEEQDYRYWAWKMEGFTQGQRLPVSNEKHKEIRAQGKREIDELRSKLSANAVFQQLGQKEKRHVLEEGKWRLLPGNERQQSWRQIGLGAGLGKIISSHMYRHLSGYAHSGSISIRQIRLSLESKEALILMGAAMNAITIVTANFIRGYCDIFPRSKAVLTADAEGSEMVDTFIQVGQKLGIEESLSDEGKNS